MGVRRVRSVFDEMSGIEISVLVENTTRASWAHDPIGSGEPDFEQIARTLSSLQDGAKYVLETLHHGDVAQGLAGDLAALRTAGGPVGSAQVVPPSGR